MSFVKSFKSFTGTGFPISNIDPSTYRGLMADLFLAGGQGPLQQFIYKDRNSSLEAYTKCPPFSSVINKKAQAYINGKTFVMDPKGEKESNTPFAKNLRLLWQRPNPIQNARQFEAQNYIYQQIFGFCPTLKVYPFGRPDKMSKWNIPPNILNIVEKKTSNFYNNSKWQDFIEKIEIVYGNDRSDITNNDGLFIFRDFSPSADSVFIPESKAKCLEQAINNIICAMDSRGTLISQRGAMGILSSGEDKQGYVPLKKAEIEQIQKDFLRQHGIRSSQFRFLITSAAVNWQAISMATKDLMLFEEIEDDTYQIADTYQCPVDLLGISKRKTYQNAPEAEVGLYQNAIMPESESIYEHWNDFYDCLNNGVLLVKDYSHIPSLQENKVNTGRALAYVTQGLNLLWLNDMITANQFLNRCDFDSLDGPDGDQFYSDWKKSGKIFTPPVPTNTTEPKTEPTTPSQLDTQLNEGK